MPISWNEIRNNALAFTRRWEGEASERAEAQSFWNEFFAIFGIDRKRVAIFEKQVEIAGAGRKVKHGRIDCFWKGMLLVEHKSAGQDLDLAFAQAADYFDGLPERDLPRYVLVSDFQRFHLYDLEAGKEWQFPLAKLHSNVRHFGFIAGYRVQEIEPQNPVNIKAAERMGRLHDLLKASGYVGHPLELLLVRLLFCLFADDTGIFQPAQAFRTWLDERTSDDGSDLGPALAQLFQVLNQPDHARPRSLDEQVAAFPYVNGKLFEEALPIAAFDRKMRETLLDCCALDWSAISPAVFGALFQSIMDAKARRNLGAHYTSEENILKVVKPLFLDDLWEEFHKVKGNKNRLFEFHKRLRLLTFLDPACGCGNFLVISYRELRKLEIEILRHVHQSGQRALDVHTLVAVDVDQFYGIEIEEFPAQIAQVALWLVDHQMNTLISEEFGTYYARIPLVSTPHILNANALRVDWNDVLPAERCSYVLGNPPFVGKQHQDADQKEALLAACSGIDGAGILDFVAGWYAKAAAYMANTEIQCAFVSTNSIAQGEQVGTLWGWLLAKGIRIQFAHRTFRWSNEGRGVAAVHCVVVGFAMKDRPRKLLFEYESADGAPHAVVAQNINPYLVDAPDVVLPSRRTPICNISPVRFGSMPNDGGHLLLSDADRTALLENEPEAAHWIKPFLSADEFINGIARWCLWLVDCPPNVLRRMPEVARRVALVKEHRERSARATTNALSAMPTLFGEIRQPSGSYVVIPRHSSERRRLIPLGRFTEETIVGDSNLCVPDASLSAFGVLSSTMHNAWVRYTCGRIKSDFRYSASIVYNNFPWPEALQNGDVVTIDATAEGVLEARAQFASASLADLYDPLAMPPALVKAHQKLDAAVDAAYGRRGFKNDAERVAFLFELYQRLTSLLPFATAGGRAKRKRGP